MEPVARAPRRRAPALGLLPVDPAARPRAAAARLGQGLAGARAAVRVLRARARAAARRPTSSSSRQLFGDRMIVANATGCSSIYGGNLPTTPWTTNAEGRGPAWSNSLFEDNAEFGLGHAPRRSTPRTRHARELLARDRRRRSAPALAARRSSAPTQDDEARSSSSASASRACARCSSPAAPVDGPSRRTRRPAPARGRRQPRPPGRVDHRRRRLGLRHRLRRPRPRAVVRVATSTSSCSTPRCTRTPAARRRRRRRAARSPSSPPAARRTGKKDLGAIARAYGNVYVAQIAMGANDLQTTKALLEADAWPGPSLVIAYSTCIAHGIDMSKSMSHQKDAVKSGYWPLYRFHPSETEDGQPFKLDSHAPSIPVRDFVADRGPLRHPGAHAPRAGAPASPRWPRPTSTSAGATTSSSPGCTARSRTSRSATTGAERESDAGYARRASSD